MREVAPGGGGQLPTYDPWPDDPSQFDDIAAGLTSREDDAEEVRVSLAGLLGDPALDAWMGASANAFKSTLSPVPGLLGQMGDAYNQAAAAVRTYAQKVRDGQSSFAKVQLALQNEAISEPQAVDGPSGLAAQLKQHAQDAAADYHTAMSNAASAVATADDELRTVKSALSDPRYASFNATFTKAGGSLSDLSTGLSEMGDDIWQAELQSVNDAITNKSGALPPDAVRAEIQDMVNQYGNIPGFWMSFGPTLGLIPGYLTQHDKLPDGSLPPQDQALMSLLSQQTAKAASNGDLSFLIGPTTSGAALLGLAQLVATDGNGKDFGDAGAQFLADLTTQLANDTTSLPFNGPQGPYNILPHVPGPDDASQQGMQAALNVVRATAAFSSWDPSNNEHAYFVGKLPPAITGALYNYGNAYPVDGSKSLQQYVNQVQSAIGLHQ